MNLMQNDLHRSHYTHNHKQYNTFLSYTQISARMGCSGSKIPSKYGPHSNPDRNNFHARYTNADFPMLDSNLSETTSSPSVSDTTHEIEPSVETHLDVPETDTVRRKMKRCKRKGRRKTSHLNISDRQKQLRIISRELSYVFRDTLGDL